MFNVYDWYWKVTDTGRLYSSKRNTYVNPGDSDFAAWKISGGNTEAVPIGSEPELWYYMKEILPEWLRDKNGLFAQPAAGEYNKDQLRSYSLNKRFLTENGGMWSAAIAEQIRTDDHAKQLLTMARIEAEEQTTYKSRLMGKGITQHTAAQVISVSEGLTAFVESVFATYATLDGQITAGTVTTLPQIDAAYHAVVPTGP